MLHDKSLWYSTTIKNHVLNKNIELWYNSKEKSRRQTLCKKWSKNNHTIHLWFVYIFVMYIIYTQIYDINRYTQNDSSLMNVISGWWD